MMTAILAKLEERAQEAEVSAEAAWDILMRSRGAMHEARTADAATAIAGELRAARRRAAFNRAYDHDRSRLQ